MKLQPVLESLDDIPEDYRENYEPTADGKFELTLVKGMVAKGDGDQDTYDELRGALDNSRKDTKDVKGKFQSLVSAVESLGGIDALKELKDAQAEAERTNLEKKGDYERLLDQVKVEHGKEIDVYVKQIAALTARLDRETRGRQVMEAIASHDGNPNLLQPILMQATKLVGDDPEELHVEVVVDGSPLVDKDGKILTVKGYVERLPEDEAFAGAFKGSGASGGGGSGEQSPAGDGGSGGSGGGIPPDLANFRRGGASATDRAKVIRRLQNELYDGDYEKAHEHYLSLPD